MIISWSKQFFAVDYSYLDITITPALRSVYYLETVHILVQRRRLSAASLSPFSFAGLLLPL